MFSKELNENIKKFEYNDCCVLTRFNVINSYCTVWCSSHQHIIIWMPTETQDSTWKKVTPEWLTVEGACMLTVTHMTWPEGAPVTNTSVQLLWLTWGDCAGQCSMYSNTSVSLLWLTWSDCAGQCSMYSNTSVWLLWLAWVDCVEQCSM